MLAEMTRAVPAPVGGPDTAGAAYGLGLMRVPLSCGGYAWGHDGGLIGVGNVSVRSTSGREATVYITALTGQAYERVWHTVDVALCDTGNGSASTGQILNSSHSG
jgi:D-alanyl-D-alanine carboxypeptidase